MPHHPASEQAFRALVVPAPAGLDGSVQGRAAQVLEPEVHSARSVHLARLVHSVPVSAARMGPVFLRWCGQWCLAGRVPQGSCRRPGLPEVPLVGAAGPADR